MDYKRQLDLLRKQVFEEPAPTPVKKSSFIPMKTEPEQKEEDPLEFARTLLRSSKEAANKVKEKPIESFSSGFSKGVSGVIKREAEIKAEAKNKVSLIDRPVKSDAEIGARRGGLPSKYAPMASNAKGFLGLIDQTEGGGDYDTLFGFSNREGKFAGTKVSQMTIDELADFSNPRGAYGQWVKSKVGRVATPMGRYQFVGSTMKEVAKKMGLSGDTVFSPEVQDAMFNFYLNEKINSSDTIEGKVKAVRTAWEGFKSVPTKYLEDLIMSHEA